MSNEVCHRYESSDGSEVLIDVTCPGCGYGHPFRIKGEGPMWTWNGDMVKPTFSPSMLCNATVNNGANRCHSFVKDGSIQFLSDCWHELKGQTVPLPPYDESDVFP
jgi:Family of unknown function (DUF6527)